MNPNRGAALAAGLIFGQLAVAQLQTFDTTADEVCGQPDFDSLDPNFPDQLPHSYNLAVSNAATVAVARDGRIYVADADNNRVLSWPSIRAIHNGAPADFVLGQPNFESNQANNGGVSPHSLSLPQGVFVDAHGDVWVSDAFNSRVLKSPQPRCDVLQQPNWTQCHPVPARSPLPTHHQAIHAIFCWSSYGRGTNSTAQ